MTAVEPECQSIGEDCPQCGGMGMVEFPEALPCPECDPGPHLAERVLCGLDLVHNQDAIKAACKLAGVEVYEPEDDPVAALLARWVREAQSKEAGYRNRPPGLTDFGHMALGLQATVLRGCAEDLRAALGRVPNGEWPTESQLW